MRRLAECIEDPTFTAFLGSAKERSPLMMKYPMRESSYSGFGKPSIRVLRVCLSDENFLFFDKHRHDRSQHPLLHKKRGL